MSDFYYKETDGVLTLHCKALDEIEGLRHCFTTRKGGVSEGHLATMNLSFSRESADTVMENYRRLSAAEQFNLSRFTLTDQTHTTNVAAVDEALAGMGMSKESTIRNTDGLITALDDTPLAVFVADCAPILMYDKSSGAVAALHSGWRGTHGSIAAHALEKMKALYGTKPQDVIAAVGPCIGACCYEVGADFKQAFANWGGDHLFTPKGEKYMFDLKGAVRLTLQRAGVGEIYVSEECTCCKPELLFSHRATKGKRGNLAAVISKKGGVR